MWLAQIPTAINSGPLKRTQSFLSLQVVKDWARQPIVKAEKRQQKYAAEEKWRIKVNLSELFGNFVYLLATVLVRNWGSESVEHNCKPDESKPNNVTTDGSPNLTGKNVGLLRIIQNRVKDENPDQDVIFLPCIIHQESLCKSVSQLNRVVSHVVKLVNLIRAKQLQHHHFLKFLEETDADHQDLLYHSRVCWLCLGKVFQRVWELKEEIGAFLESQRKADEFLELSNKSWLCDFAFAADVFSHINELNMKLQEKDQFVQDMYTNVKAFKSKLLVACSLSQDPDTAPKELQLELIDLQSDPVLKEKFNSLKLNDFYASLYEAAFPNLRRTAQKMLALFSLTYLCEQLFSIMNINKASNSSQLTDQHLRSILRIATTKLTPDFDALAKKGDQQHCSH
ncbi:general transcription factor II-I repeat domain-containing protein 2A-like [Watersipora subatra]|uniref:general transcription factor II-I repeat domain-containing protein 2A-like n=1 Tax=Watersipora subatra TaxID=2589382 RepID=UPI00355BA2AF